MTECLTSSHNCLRSNSCNKSPFSVSLKFSSFKPYLKQKFLYQDVQLLLACMQLFFSHLYLKTEYFMIQFLCTARCPNKINNKADTDRISLPTLPTPTCPFSVLRGITSEPCEDCLLLKEQIRYTSRPQLLAELKKNHLPQDTSRILLCFCDR